MNRISTWEKKAFIGIFSEDKADSADEAERLAKERQDLQAELAKRKADLRAIEARQAIPSTLAQGRMVDSNDLGFW